MVSISLELRNFRVKVQSKLYLNSKNISGNVFRKMFCVALKLKTYDLGIIPKTKLYIPTCETNVAKMLIKCSLKNGDF